eukprot:1459786-Alexandrium_andersonii.AAC.1
MRHIFPGPGMWCVPNDLWALRSQLGLPFAVPNLRNVGIAAKVRLYVSEIFFRERNWRDASSRKTPLTSGDFVKTNPCRGSFIPWT